MSCRTFIATNCTLKRRRTKLDVSKSCNNVTKFELEIIWFFLADIYDFIQHRGGHLMVPFLLCIGSLERPINFYLRTEQTFVRLGSDVTHAFTVL